MDGKDDEALVLLNQSLAAKPDPIIFSNRGDLKKKLGDLKGAIADYDEALRLLPGNSTLYSNRGLYKHELGDLDGAIADYAKAVELEPKSVEFRASLSFAKRNRGDYAGAIAELDRIIAVAPEPLYYMSRADNKQLKGDFAGAVQDSTKVIALKPKSWGGYVQRGAAKQALGDLEGAYADYDKATTVTGEHVPSAWAFRELTLRRLKRGTPDAEFAKIAARGKPGFSQDMGLYLAGVLTEADFLAKAGEGGAAAAAGKRCAAFYLVGMTKLIAGDREEARKLLEQSVAAKDIDGGEFVLARAELARLSPAAKKGASK